MLPCRSLTRIRCRYLHGYLPRGLVLEFPLFFVPFPLCSTVRFDRGRLTEISPVTALCGLMSPAPLREISLPVALCKLSARDAPPDSGIRGEIFNADLLNLLITVQYPCKSQTENVGQFPSNALRGIGAGGRPPTRFAV